MIYVPIGTVIADLVPEVLKVDEEIREDPGIYPPRELRARLVTTESPPAETQRLRTRAWTRATTGR